MSNMPLKQMKHSTKRLTTPFLVKDSMKWLGTTMLVGTGLVAVGSQTVAHADEIASNNQQITTNNQSGRASIGHFQSRQDFINQIGASAQTVAAQNDLYASVMIAQAILESGWGNSTLAAPPNHNLFGIKGNYYGQSVAMQTGEYFNNQWVTITDHFRKYPSYAESLQDNAWVLKTTSFYPGVPFYGGAWKSRTTSYRDATAWLTGRYATDPGYAGKLNGIIEAYGLTAYDTPGGNTQGMAPSPAPSAPVTPSPSAPNNENTVVGETYRVVAGDTLYRISQRFGVSVGELKLWNNLSSDLIRVGQELVVTKKLADEPSAPETQPEIAEKPAAPSVPNKPEVAPEKPTQTGSEYKVVAGDTLYSIAQRHGVSVAQLKQWNQLSSDVILVGQVLNVSSTVTETEKPSTPQVTQPSTPQATEKSYKVASGDTLYRISQRFGVSVQNIKDWNYLKSDVIFVGQQLVLKQPTNSVKPSPKPTAPSRPDTSSGTYRVKAGDTLYSIANRHNMTVAQLKSLNQLTSDMIIIGQTLSLSGTTSKPVVAQPKPAPVKPANAATYQVKAGDTLYRIATNNGLSVSELKNINQLASDRISIGQVLKLNGNVNSSGSIAAKPSAPASTVTANASTSQASTYRVQSGDTLYKIAKKFDTSVANLKNWNQLPNDTIVVGQTLKVQAKAPEQGKQTYQVKAGDTLWKIAQHFNVSVAQLKEMNQLSSDAISINQVLVIK
ncbi:LysM peptidoglycan-binding domain-containing protein [Vagococcus lutrae]|uniref:LysM peptidoglycan-binding domain-containing protein n=1 Tax=Vagococcus lutrae TaxID=81947 RepID=UPI002096EF65|nr:LysM peptidoglycan-binding domain-containing protein [Vagococcus lutrae]MCO7151810.1 LysM peptidoglycan-binding domain-containing protein [Vagococcus lutrae]MDT2819928.1 LysM peptidoglycan-binding domain-containing protein [Vagococcus lutrae]MDT2844866.1 LysM peptidoglycan-binding domain-containing protein [Vagococcus lutrae]WCG05695.1 LysM peptidoglycan-binding domain-containing protein [Vagococcus lutrae]